MYEHSETADMILLVMHASSKCEQLELSNFLVFISGSRAAVTSLLQINVN